ncbi:hypothetical protein PN462_08490 [Spirulina sp. CS-785/01]|uniref:Sll0314/Alr1548 family TPR repeat-containing protein n=1 Tax=Spirulina sp. CS-785/01 TaxID=3021716 RepID=UPI00232C4B26|nr:Sll0314/Alr1548 family TPR repeat-containing protein [Spirulina sp. CS-785/01]MDB9313137.1 hypothetical protein [Spirulina sp. CS-785/01]
MAKRRFSLVFSSLVALSVSFWSGMAFAGDPFRSQNPRPIGDQTEAAFEAFFMEGNYPEAVELIQQAATTETNDPLTNALMAALAYNQQDWSGLQTQAQNTLDTAEQIMADDPLRGNLYTAIGHFLEGIYKFEQQGPVGAVAKLGQVLRYMDKAAEVNPNDPELNLIKGYMDLIIAVHLPMSDPSDAIANLERNAAPSYLVHRGIALAYRDIGQSEKDTNQRKDTFENALEYVNRALEETPDNPEVIYLKAQILHELGHTNNDDQDTLENAIALFGQVKAHLDQLPAIPQLDREINIACSRAYPQGPNNEDSEASQVCQAL